LDLFDKCRSFTRADEVKKLGCYPYFKVIEANDGPVVTIEGRHLIMAGSNNYLGLTTHPKVKEAAINAVRKYGSGNSGSRFLNGTLDIHIQLEESLAKFIGKEAALTFSTGYQTNQGVIATLVGKDDYVISDKENHASIVVGTLMVKGSGGGLARFQHNDMADLERVVSALPLDAGKLIVVDGVFSMSGDIVNLPALVSLAQKYNARVMVDDAHALGVLGTGGRGTASHFGLDGSVDLIMGTFSKSLASQGGFVAGDQKVMEYLKHHSSAFTFSASPTPAAAAAALAALEIIEEEPERIDRLRYNSNKIRNGLKDLGFSVIMGETAVVPVIIGDDMKTFIFWKGLFDAGVFVNAVISPAVPQGQQLLRTSFMATHEDAHLDQILHAFERVGKQLGIIH